MTLAAASGTARTIVIAATCFALGGLAMYLFRDTKTQDPAPVGASHSDPSSAAAAAAAPTPSDGPLPDLRVTLSPEMAKRAGLEVGAVGTAAIESSLRVPATVAPNQYRQVQVSSVVGGQVTRVSAELGDRVSRGAALAQIFSADLAEAQTRYLSSRADLAAAEERLQRTTRLVTIGAASQQELEQTQAERTRFANQLEGEAARLRLIGMPAAAIQRLKSAADISASLTLVSPADGVVTERTANVGAIVTPSVPLFVISSISPVWVIADVAERDLQRVRVGTSATVLVEGAPPVAAKVVYIAPDVRAETRTAQVRVEVPNPAGRLRFGMLVTLAIRDTAPASDAVLTVPESAVQSIGGRTFVYLADDAAAGEFVEREVVTGARSDGQVEILRGLQKGDSVVTRGSFYVRAERERLSLRPAASAAAPQAGARTVDVTVTATAFDPARIEVPAGTHVKLRVTRKAETTCGTDLVVAGKKAVEHLPLNQPVEVDLGVVTKGEVTFTCGMNMLKGTVVVH